MVYLSCRDKQSAQANGTLSEDARVFKRILQDGLLDGGKDESDVRSIGGLCETIWISKCC